MPDLHHNRFRAAVTALVIAAVCVSAQTGAIAADAIAPNQDAIADVAAGRLTTARASWWGFHPTDSTKVLQAAFNSRAKKVLVENMGRPWIVTTITLPSDKVIEFESGTIIEAKRGEFRGKGDCLFVARGCKNLTLRGAGAIFRMHKSDYHKPPYQLAEWRHTLSIRGCKNVLVEGLALVQSGGDGVYLGVGRGGETNLGVTIRNVVCDGNNRQGISVITAENLLIEDCIFRNTRGTAPEAGIDFEPNHPSERLVNCVLRNCLSENNAGHAYHNYLGHMNQESTPISIRFEDCRSKECGRYSTYVGIANRIGDRTVRGTIEYVGCSFDSDRGAGVYIRGNEADGCHVRFERCEIVRQDRKGSRLAPITIEAPRRLDLDVGNVEISDCLIRDSIVRQPVTLLASPMVRIRNVHGKLTLESPSGKQTFVLDEQQLDKWFPEQGRVAKIPRTAFAWKRMMPVVSERTSGTVDATFRLRRHATFLIMGNSGQPTTLAVKIEPVGRHVPAKGTMTLTEQDGKTQKLTPVTKEKRLEYSFTTPGSRPVRLDWQGSPQETLRIVSCSTPIAIYGAAQGVDLFRSTGTLFFPVPAGVRRFAIQVGGAGTAETVKVSVRDPSQQMVAQKDNIAAPHVFVLSAHGAVATEIWSLTFERAAEGVLEDVSVQTLGFPPIFGATPGDLLAPAPDHSED